MRLPRHRYLHLTSVECAHLVLHTCIGTSTIRGLISQPLFRLSSLPSTSLLLLPSLCRPTLASPFDIDISRRNDASEPARDVPPLSLAPTRDTAAALLCPASWLGADEGGLIQQPHSHVRTAPVASHSSLTLHAPGCATAQTSFPPPSLLQHVAVLAVSVAPLVQHSPSQLRKLPSPISSSILHPRR